MSSPREYLVRLADTAGELAVKIADIEMNVQQQAEQICEKMEGHKSAGEIFSRVSGLSKSCEVLADELSTLRTVIDVYVSERFQAASPSTMGAQSSRVGPVQQDVRLQQEGIRLFYLGTDVEGGRSFFKATDDCHASSLTLQEFPGTRKYDLHGSPSHVSICGERLDAKQFANVIRQDPKWKNQPITLFSCNTGKVPDQGGQPIAQLLATELGVDVHAPTELAWGYEDGSYKISSEVINDKNQRVPKIPEDGCLKKFIPLVETSRARS